MEKQLRYSNNMLGCYNGLMYPDSPIFKLLKRKHGFAGGIASLLGWSDASELYDPKESGAEADYKAIQSDWAAIGGDLMFAINEFAEENHLEIEAAESNMQNNDESNRPA